MKRYTPLTNKLGHIILNVLLLVTVYSNSSAQVDSPYACELCLLEDNIMDRMDSIGLVINNDGSITYNKEKATPKFISEQNELETQFSEGIFHFKKILSSSDSVETFEKIQELCFQYKYNEPALTQKERDSIIDLYQLLRYENFNVLNYSSFLSELEKLIPEYDSLGNPLVSWKTKIKDHRNKGFIEGEVYKLWYETFPVNYDLESWKLDQKDSLKAWNNQFRQIGINFFGWNDNDPGISDDLLHWKLTYYLIQKSKREFEELKRKFSEEGDKEAYYELSMIYMEVVNGDEKTLELELYAARNFHWCSAYVNAFEFYSLLNEQPDHRGYNDLPPEVRRTMEELLEEGAANNCSECIEMLESIRNIGSPYPK